MGAQLLRSTKHLSRIKTGSYVCYAPCRRICVLRPQVSFSLVTTQLQGLIRPAAGQLVGGLTR